MFPYLYIKHIGHGRYQVGVARSWSAMVAEPGRTVYCWRTYNERLAAPLLQYLKHRLEPYKVGEHYLVPRRQELDAIAAALRGRHLTIAGVILYNLVLLFWYGYLASRFVVYCWLLRWPNTYQAIKMLHLHRYPAPPRFKGKEYKRPTPATKLGQWYERKRQTDATVIITQ